MSDEHEPIEWRNRLTGIGLSLEAIFIPAVVDEDVDVEDSCLYPSYSAELAPQVLRSSISVVGQK